MGRGKARRPKRPSKKTSCGTKEKMTQRDAIKKVGELFRKDGAKMRAYRCHYVCYLEDGSKAWHVGHQHFNPFSK